jgi:hypothetical protein
VLCWYKCWHFIVSQVMRIIKLSLIIVNWHMWLLRQFSPFHFFFFLLLFNFRWHSSR